MRKILLGLLTAGAVGGVTMFATGAFFSDTETSTGNTFTAGAIDLKVSNACYYNGQACVLNTVTTGDETDRVWERTGEPCACTWTADNLKGQLFFNFADLKPGDWEEDTIDLTVDNNDAWACAQIRMTKNDDVSSTEPELDGTGDVLDTIDEFDGELASHLKFMWWVDDGDNVLESNENVLFGGPVTFAQMVGEDKVLDLTLADAQMSIFPTQGPMVGLHTYYIGKAFCYGEFGGTPVPAGQGDNPTVNPGFTCSGENETNITQTDQVVGDLSFSVVQHRNNARFLCPEHRLQQ